MNVRINNLLSIVLILAIAMVGCDRIEDDALPIGDALFTPESDSRTITPGSSVIIDLATAIQANQQVSFRTGEAPSRGRVSFHGNGLMEYEPDDTFSSGQDDFTVEMLNADSVVLDAEEFTIEMVGQTADLPCFNGALGDYAWTAKGQSVIVLPLVNDGFCESEIESFSFRTDQPEHGEVNLISPLEVEYVPDPDFLGLDYFFYTLTLVDKSGEEFISTAKVEIEVSDELPLFENCLEELLSASGEIYFDPTSEEDHLLLELNIEDCLGANIDVLIDYVLNGEAEVDGDLLLYYPDFGKDSVDVIGLKLVFDQDTLTIDLPVIIGEDPFECFELSFPSQHMVIEELDLEYEFELYIPETGCELSQWDIEILETFHGSAEVSVDDNWLKFIPDEGPNTDNYYGVVYEVFLASGESLVREIIIEVDDSFHFECIEQFIHPETVFVDLEDLAEGEIVIFELSDDCALSIDSLEVIESELGATNFDGNRVLYSPNDQFVNQALVILLVVLPETGEVYEKLIEIILEDDPFGQCGEEAFPNQQVSLDIKGEQSYILPVYFLPPDCSPVDRSLMLAETSNGEVDIAANGEDLVWYPNYADFDQEAEIVFVVELADGIQLERNIAIEFAGEQDCFEEAFPNQEISLGTPNDIQFEIQVAFSHPLCLFPAWELDITNVSSGDAEFNTETASIVYTLDSTQTESVVVIAYNIVFDNGDFEPRELALIFDSTEPNCAEAFEDEYFYVPLVEDSVDIALPAIRVPLIIDPALNDQYCTDNYEIHILEYPDLGEAEVIDGQLIQYQVFDEFSGRRETTIKYEICDSGKCDENFINITVEQ